MLVSQKTVGNWLYSVLPAVLYRADICSWQDADSDPASAPGHKKYIMGYNEDCFPG